MPEYVRALSNQLLPTGSAGALTPMGRVAAAPGRASSPNH
jgi:hypothetical protein